MRELEGTDGGDLGRGGGGGGGGGGEGGGGGAVWLSPLRHCRPRGSRRGPRRATVVSSHGEQQPTAHSQPIKRDQARVTGRTPPTTHNRPHATNHTHPAAHDRPPDQPHTTDHTTPTDLAQHEALEARSDYSHLGREERVEVDGEGDLKLDEGVAPAHLRLGVGLGGGQASAGEQPTSCPLSSLHPLSPPPPPPPPPPRPT